MSWSLISNERCCKCRVSLALPPRSAQIKTLSIGLGGNTIAENRQRGLNMVARINVQPMARLKVLEGFRSKRLMEVASILETEAEFNQMVTGESISKPLLCPLGKAHLSEGGVWCTLILL